MSVEHLTIDDALARVDQMTRIPVSTVNTWLEGEPWIEGDMTTPEPSSDGLEGIRVRSKTYVGRTGIQSTITQATEVFENGTVNHLQIDQPRDPRDIQYVFKSDGVFYRPPEVNSEE